MQNFISKMVWTTQILVVSYLQRWNYFEKSVLETIQVYFVYSLVKIINHKVNEYSWKAITKSNFYFNFIQQANDTFQFDISDWKKKPMWENESNFVF